MTRAKSGRISFFDVLSAVPPFSRGTARGLSLRHPGNEVDVIPVSPVWIIYEQHWFVLVGSHSLSLKTKQIIIYNPRKTHENNAE